VQRPLAMHRRTDIIAAQRLLPKEDPMRSLLVLLGLFSLTAELAAGELRLENGARLPGELVAITGTRLVWNAGLIGKIEIDKQHVLEIDSSNPVDLSISGHGNVRKCRLHGTVASTAIRCEGEPDRAAPLAEIGRLAPDWESTGKATASLTLERGNKSSDEIELDGKASWKRGSRRHTLDLSVDYEEKRDVKVNDEAELSYQADFLRRNGWYYYLRLEYDRDRFSSLQESALIGPGVGREMEFGRALKLRLQGGIDEYRFDLADYGRFTGEGGNLQWRLDWETGLWKLEFFHEGEFKWVLDDADVNRLDTKTGVTIPLIDRLIAELSLEYDRSGKTSSANKPDDYEWVFKLGYRW
jgi:hypothetical protein